MLALNAIKAAFVAKDEDAGVVLFVEHHLEELPRSYWQQHLGSQSPAPEAVVALLRLRSTWGDGDMENFDFTLPDEVTDYVVSVNFDRAGDIDRISMES